MREVPIEMPHIYSLVEVSECIPELQQRHGETVPLKCFDEFRCEDVEEVPGWKEYSSLCISWCIQLLLRKKQCRYGLCMHNCQKHMLSVERLQ